MRRTLFEIEKPPRAKRRVMMHVIDAGDCGGCHEQQMDVVVQCLRCHHKSDWIRVQNMTEARRGIPCPHCNKGTQDD